MSTTTFCALANRISSRDSLVSCVVIGLTGLSLIVAKPAVAYDLESVTVPINVTVVPGQPVDLFFTEIFDVIHHKDLLFQGVAHGVPGAVGILDVQFDWLDPLGGIQLSPVFPVDVIGDTPFSIPFQIPFCPEQISLHLVNSGPVPSIPIVIEGTFHYECIPEPSSLVLATFGFLGLAAWGWRRTRCNG